MPYKQMQRMHLVKFCTHVYEKIIQIAKSRGQENGEFLINGYKVVAGGLGERGMKIQNTEDF